MPKPFKFTITFFGEIADTVRDVSEHDFIRLATDQFLAANGGRSNTYFRVDDCTDVNDLMYGRFDPYWGWRDDVSELREMHEDTLIQVETRGSGKIYIWKTIKNWDIDAAIRSAGKFFEIIGYRGVAPGYEREIVEAYRRYESGEQYNHSTNMADQITAGYGELDSVGNFQYPLIVNQGAIGVHDGPEWIVPLEEFRTVMKKTEGVNAVLDSLYKGEVA